MTSRQSLAMVAAGMLVMQGCLGPDIVQETPPPTPAIEVAPHSPTATVHEGLVSNATVRVNLTRHGGFAGPVAVTLEGLPPGVAAAQGSIGANATSVNLALTVGAGAGRTASGSSFFCCFCGSPNRRRSIASSSGARARTGVGAGAGRASSRRDCGAFPALPPATRCRS